jgi:hypothetical protein
VTEGTNKLVFLIRPLVYEAVTQTANLYQPLMLMRVAPVKEYANNFIQIGRVRTKNLQQARGVRCRYGIIYCV